MAYDDVSVPVSIRVDKWVRVFERDPYYWKSVLNPFIYANGKTLLFIKAILGIVALSLLRDAWNTHILTSIFTTTNKMLVVYIFVSK